MNPVSNIYTTNGFHVCVLFQLPIDTTKSSIIMLFYFYDFLSFFGLYCRQYYFMEDSDKSIKFTFKK